MLHRGIVVAVGFAAHRSDHSGYLQGRPIILRSVMHAAIGVMDQSGLLLLPAHGHRLRHRRGRQRQQALQKSRRRSMHSRSSRLHSSGQLRRDERSAKPVRSEGQNRTAIDTKLASSVRERHIRPLPVGLSNNRLDLAGDLQNLIGQADRDLGSATHLSSGRVSAKKTQYWSHLTAL
jgi:protein required for attachment to host cells